MSAFRIPTVMAVAALLFLGATIIPSTGLAAADSTLVFLVRHAEKVDETRDPELSEAGKQRSRDLAGVLRDAGIQRIHSTDFIRTRDTAAPLAKLLGLEIQLYDWEDPAEFARSLKKDRGRHLVVGHSNTTPELVGLLGGDPGAEIDHADEHDRLYILSIDSRGKVTTVLIRYGTPFKN